jgi:hypothetical protein
MMLEVLSPCVQHTQKTNVRAEMPLVRGDFRQGFCGCAKEQVIKGFLVLQRHTGQLVWQREDHMKVGRCK